MKASTEQLVSALRVLSVEIHSEDGVANAVVAEAAERLTLMANLVAQHVQETKDDVEQMAIASETMVEATAKIQELRARIKHLEEWKESALAVEREWNANALATMLGGRPGESQREVIQREVPKLLERIKRLEEESESRWMLAQSATGSCAEMSSRIKRLEEVGNEMSKWLDRNTPVTVRNDWRKAKEAKP